MFDTKIPVPGRRWPVTCLDFRHPFQNFFFYCESPLPKLIPPQVPAYSAWRIFSIHKCTPLTTTVETFGLRTDRVTHVLISLCRWPEFQKSPAVGRRRISSAEWVQCFTTLLLMIPTRFPRRLRTPTIVTYEMISHPQQVSAPSIRLASRVWKSFYFHENQFDGRKKLSRLIICIYRWHVLFSRVKIIRTKIK